MDKKNITIPLVRSGVVASSCEIELKRKGESFYLTFQSGPLKGKQFEGVDYFRSLSEARKALEEQSFFPAIQGACIDVYPGGFLSDNSDGLLAYRWSDSQNKLVVEIFDEISPAEFERLSDLDSQREARRVLIRGSNGRR